MNPTSGSSADGSATQSQLPTLEESEGEVLPTEHHRVHQRGWLRKDAKAVFVLSWIGFFGFLLLYMTPKWNRTDFGGALIGSTARSLADRWPVGPDYASYYQAALSWYRNGILADETWHWVTNIWPPGMVLLHYSILEVFGLDSRPLIVLVVITAAVWATVFAIGMAMCRTWGSSAIYLAGVAGLLLTTSFSQWIAGGNLALPTGFSVAFALLAMVSARRLASDSSPPASWPSPREAVRHALVVGPLLALSVLFRVSSLWTVYLLVLVAVAAGAALALALVKRRLTSEPGSSFSRRAAGLRLLLVRLVLIVVVPLFVALVWTLKVSDAAHPQQLSYTVTVPELVYGAAWRTDEQLVTAGSDWLLSTSSNWACRIDQTTCAAIERAERDSPMPYAGVDEYGTRDYVIKAVEAGLRNPLAYVRERAPKAWDFWAAGNAMQGVFFLMSSALAILVAARAILHRGDIEALIFVSFVVTATLPMLWILFYFYYFIPIQVASVFYLITNQSQVREFMCHGLRRGVPT